MPATIARSLRYLAFAAAIAGLTPRTPAQQTVNFETTGERVGVLLSELGPKLGLPLAADKSTANGVVAIDVKDVPKQDLLNRLANVLGATWQQSDGKTYLVRSLAEVRKERLAERRRAIDEIQEVQSELAAELSRNGSLTAASAGRLADELAVYVRGLPQKGVTDAQVQSGADLMLRGPMGRGIAMFQLRIPAEDLADLPLGIRTVYSTAPTRLQHPFSEDAENVVQQIAADQATWASAAGSRTFSPRQGVYMGDLARFNYPFPAQPVRALLAVARISRDDDFSYELILVDKTGQTVAEAIETFPSRLKAPEVPAADDVVPLPASVLALADLAGRPPGELPDLAPEQRERIQNPEKYDPLGLVVGPELVAIANLKHENLVASLSDRFWPASPIAATERTITVRSIFQSLERYAAIDEKDGWLTVRPLTPAQDRDAAVDRGKLAAYLQEETRQLGLSIDQKAQWATVFPHHAENGIPRTLATILKGRLSEPIAGSEAETMFEEDALRFYGTLSESDRTAARSQGLALSSLNQTSNDALTRLILQTTFNLDLSRAPDPPPNIDGIGREPTESLAEGFPEGSRLNLQEVVATVAMSPADGPIPSRMLTTLDMATLLTQNLWDAVRQSAPAPMPLQYLYGSSRWVNVRLAFGPIFRCVAPLHELILASASPVAFQDLPDDFRTQVNATVEQQRRNFDLMPKGAGAAPAHP